MRVKLGVYDAVVRAKLIYGLESFEIDGSVITKLDAFNLTGLRKNPHVQTTHVNMRTQINLYSEPPTRKSMAT